MPPPKFPIVRPQQPIPPAPTIDWDKITDTLVEKLANDPRFRGPPGPAGDPGAAGPPGAQGPAGPAGPVAEIDYARISADVLNQIDYARIAALVVVPPYQPPTSAGERHLVVVGNRAASWWPRLESDVRRAQETYRGLDIAPQPPFDAGVLPQLIEYRDGKPKVLARGLREVSDVLAKISRGEVE